MRHLTHALAVAEHGGFRRAARVLGVSQSALTRSIQVLEAEVGAVLFDRLPGGVLPTGCGEVLLRWAKQIDADSEGMRRELRQVLGLEAGEVRVALGPYPADLLATPAVARLLDRGRGLRFTLRTCAWKEVYRRVREQDVDVGIGEIPVSLEDPLLEFTPLGRHALVWFCRSGHPLEGRQGLTFDDLLDFPWAGGVVTPRMAVGFPRHAVRAGRPDEATGAFLLTVRTYEFEPVRRIVRACDAISAATLTQLEEDLVAGRLHALPVQKEGWRLNYGFIRLKGRSPSPAVEAFLAAIREVEAEVAAREQALRGRWLGRVPPAVP